ncbi:MAG: SusC/RagA family TonB-linked outer membrane protein [Bacteroidota bacterium]
MNAKLQKLVIRMSKLAIYVTACCLSMTMVFGTESDAQRKLLREISFEIEEGTYVLGDVLHSIEENTDFSFAYLNNEKWSNTTVDLEGKVWTMETILAELSSQSKVSFKRVNETITVTKPKGLKKFPAVEERVTFQNQVSGTVTDENGDGLPGATVLEKGSSNGVVTNANGQYNIAVGGDATLVISFVGMKTIEEAVNGRSIVDVSLVFDTEALEEVVVVGYGTQTKRDVTGAIAQVKSEQLEAFKAAPSFDQALQGLATGVQVSSSSGAPGAPTRVMIRGTGSIFSGTEPLWIIDGMILADMGGRELGGFSRSAGVTPQNPLATLNPNDIESIEVLKDAAATSIYGSRGANGVIIVTTKTGQTGSGTFDLSVNYGISQVLRGPEDLGFVDGQTWLSLADESRANAGLAEFDPNSLLNAARDPNAVLERGQIANTNWFDEALRDGYFTDISLSTSRASEKSSYYISGQYREDQGIQVGSNLQRFSLRNNLDFTPVPGLELSSKMNLSYTKNERAPNGGPPGGNSNLANSGYNRSMSGALPIFPIFHPTVTDANGNPILFDPLSGNNLRATLDRDNYINDLRTYRVIGAFNAEYALPFVEGLSIRSEFGYDVNHADNIEWAGRTVREDSKYGFDQAVLHWRLNYNVYAKYAQTFGIHTISATFGVENTEEAQRIRNIEAQELFGAAQQIGSPGDVTRLTSTVRGGELYFRGYFGRANYKLLDRYIVGVSFRRDAVSIFAEDLRWQNFAAISGAWIISDESFMSALSSTIDLLKIRGSFGQTGNYSIDPLAGTTGYATWGRYGDVGAGDLLTRIGNEEILWETTDAVDVGVDFELFDSRLSGSVGYYRQNVSDMLAQVRVPQSSGIFSSNPTIWANIGDMYNQGVEIQLQGVVFDRAGLTWSMSANLTTNRNEVERINNSENAELYDPNSSAMVVREGERMGYFRVARLAGIHPEGGYELIQEMDLERFEETGERVPTGNVIPATRNNMQVHLFDETEKSGLPTYFGGFSSNWSYKGIEMLAQFTFQGGNWIYDRQELASTRVIDGQGIISNAIVGNTWTESNPDAEFPQMRWNRRYDIINDDGSISANQRFDWRRTGQVTDRHLQRGDFLRLRTLQIAYTLPRNIAQAAAMKNIRVYVAANNLFTITGYDGIDPEIVNLGTQQARNTTQGWVNIQIPQVRTYNFGATFSF